MTRGQIEIEEKLEIKRLLFNKHGENAQWTNNTEYGKRRNGVHH